VRVHMCNCGGRRLNCGASSSPQLAAAILSELKMPPAEVASTVETFRRNHIQELQVHPSHVNVPCWLWLRTPALEL